MSFQSRLDSNQFLIIAELEPPKGTDTAGFIKNADSLKGRAHAILVPEMSGAIMRMGSLGASSLLKQKGFEPIMNIHSRDRNRLALQADMLSAAALGIEALFVSGGGEIASGDHMDACQVQDLGPPDLLEAAKKLQKGVDLAGSELTGAPSFCVGTEVNPGLEGSALEVEVAQMEKNIKAGARFFFTPCVYDLTVFERFIKKIDVFKVPVFAQVTILKSVGMARYMTRHMDGVSIPDAVIDRLAKAPDKNQEGIAIAADTVRRLQPLCRGALLTAVGAQERLAGVLDHAGI